MGNINLGLFVRETWNVFLWCVCVRVMIYHNVLIEILGFLRNFFKGIIVRL